MQLIIFPLYAVIMRIILVILFFTRAGLNLYNFYGSWRWTTLPHYQLWLHLVSLGWKIGVLILIVIEHRVIEIVLKRRIKKWLRKLGVLIFQKIWIRILKILSVCILKREVKWPEHCLTRLIRLLIRLNMIKDN